MDKINAEYEPVLIKERFDIRNLQETFGLNQSDFDDLFKSELPNVAYRLYKRGMQEKSEALRRKISKVGNKSLKLVYIEKVSKRRRLVKKEWIWSGARKDKMEYYYNLFRRPAKTFEYKYSLLLQPDTKGGHGNDRKVSYLVFYIYKVQGKKKLYYIDPDVFLDSIL